MLFNPLGYSLSGSQIKQAQACIEKNPLQCAAQLTCHYQSLNKLVSSLDTIKDLHKNRLRQYQVKSDLHQLLEKSCYNFRPYLQKKGLIDLVSTTFIIINQENIERIVDAILTTPFDEVIVAQFRKE